MLFAKVGGEKTFNKRGVTTKPSAGPEPAEFITYSALNLRDYWPNCAKWISTWETVLPKATNATRLLIVGV